MTTVVISQPMLFPWPGFFELFSVADCYVHLDNVQFADKSFTNRVQIKHSTGPVWMTIPIRDRSGRRPIDKIEALDDKWRRRHRELVRHSLSKAPFLDDALTLFDQAYSKETIVDLLIESIEGSAKYLGVHRPQTIFRSSKIDVITTSTQRIVDIVRQFGGTRYVTAHGASNYLDHDAFDRANIAVEYVDYSKTPYKQLYGTFTPYVSVLDLIANLGRDATNVLHPRLVPWKEFLARKSKPA